MIEVFDQQKIGGVRRNAGRPVGTKTTETSSVVIRLRRARGLTQIQLSQELGIPFSTLRRYEIERLMPTSGPVREKIMRAAKRAGVDDKLGAEEER